MASGNITLYIQSVDYGGGRGAMYSNLNARWNVTNSGYLTLSEQGYDTNVSTWWICSSVATNINVYNVKWEVQFKPDGGSWQTLYSNRIAVLGPCSNYTYQTGTNVKAMMESFCNSFPGVQLTQSGELRVICGANLAPAPDPSYPNAFPNDVYSESSQVPVHIDVNWDARLNYDANGGSGAPSAQTASVPEATTSHDFTVSSTAPTWGDYIFLGWSTVQHTGSCTPEDVEYEAGDTFTIQKSNPTRTLYAVWMKDYRPGEVLTSGAWKSTNRTGGKCHLLSNGSWVEMRTIDGGSGTGNPPSRRTSGAWKNQYKIGSA